MALSESMVTVGKLNVDAFSESFKSVLLGANVCRTAKEEVIEKVISL